jgi:hypothetical protein
MIIILAGRYDVAAQRWAARWASHEVALLTPNDLSRAGWHHVIKAPAEGVAIVDGRPVRVAEISGVLVRLPGVYEQDLSHIVPADRSYVAAEMTAFLLSWLTTLPCPVLNRPTPTCLAGPFWRPEQWVYAAARAGIPVVPVRSRVPSGVQPESISSTIGLPPGAEGGISVTVVGTRCIGGGSEALRRHASRLAHSIGAALLGVHFADEAPGTPFVGANLWPRLDDVTTEAVFAYMREEQAAEQRS